MTTQAPPEIPEPLVATTPDQETAPLQAPDTEPVLDSFPLLDHRTRSRAISRRLAPFGHYLAFAENGTEWLVPLASKVIHIGRGLTSDVRIEEQRVSRSHAILVRHGHGTRLLDNRSANGTFVNGRRIQQADLRGGDVIVLGRVILRYLEI
jgi:hypothetical protein